MRSVVAGVVYFVPGAPRETLIAPLVGRGAAILVEALLMIAAMSLAVVQIGRRMAVPSDAASRVTMGAVGFGLLMLAEAVFAEFLRGHDLAQWIASFAKAEGVISLALFVLFAAMPMVGRKIGNRA
ncbi:MAG: hypothetical protein ABL908_11530 [Hyphomicrobium sp.]